MYATDFIAASLTMGQRWLEALVGDIEGDDLLVGPSGQDAHHTLWILGHLAASDSGLIGGFVGGEPPELADWEGLFGMGSQPVANASKYPSKAELLAAFRDQRGKTLARLSAMSDEDLDKSSHAPEQYSELMGTVAKCFMLTLTHQAFHVGQVSDIRRVLGRPPVFA